MDGDQPVGAMKLEQSQKAVTEALQSNEHDDLKQHELTTANIQISAESAMADCKYAFADCPQCQRIKAMLLKYQKTTIGNTDSKPSSSIIQSETSPALLDDNGLSVGSMFEHEYSAVAVLDDFHHLIQAHAIEQDPGRFDECYVV